MKRLMMILICLFIGSVSLANLNDDLFKAVKKGDKKKGADVNAKNNKGKTPLDLAESDEMKKIIKSAVRKKVRKRKVRKRRTRRRIR